MINTEADLGAAVNITNQWQNSNMAAGAGAGANANSTVDLMTFVGSDTLAELVWSPQTGISIKFADKKPSLMCEVGPSDISGPQNPKTTEKLSEHQDGTASGVNWPGSNIKSILKTKDMTQGGPYKNLEEGIVKIEKDGCFYNPCRENAQETILEYKKSFSCQENDEKHEVESYGSMVSCRSAKRKRILSFEQQLVLGNKRIKKQNDGSFINWISNMLKDLKNHDNQSVCDINRSFKSRKMGFQSGFQSLSLPDVKEHETMTQLDNYSDGSLGFLKIKEEEAKGVVKSINLYERVTKEAPKGIFDTIRRLRLSRTNILKWTSSRLSFEHLDGFFLRLKVAKWEEGAKGSRYYVACIRGSQGEQPCKGFKQPICVKVGGVECSVDSQYVSNCDFLEDELIAWWKKASRNGEAPFVKDLISKLAERKTLGL